MRGSLLKARALDGRGAPTSGVLFRPSSCASRPVAIFLQSPCVGYWTGSEDQTLIGKTAPQTRPSSARHASARSRSGSRAQDWTRGGPAARFDAAGLGLRQRQPHAARASQNRLGSPQWNLRGCPPLATAARCRSRVEARACAKRSRRSESSRWDGSACSWQRSPHSEAIVVAWPSVGRARRCFDRPLLSPPPMPPSSRSSQRVASPSWRSSWRAVVCGAACWYLSSRLAQRRVVWWCAHRTSALTAALLPSSRRVEPAREGKGGEVRGKGVRGKGEG